VHPSGAPTHLPLILPFPAHPETISKDIDGYDIRKLKVSQHIYVSLVGKGLRLTLSFETTPDLHLLSSFTKNWKSSFWSLKLLSKEWKAFRKEWWAYTYLSFQGGASFRHSRANPFHFLESKPSDSRKKHSGLWQS